MARGTDTGEFEIDLAGDESTTPGARKHSQTTNMGAAEPREDSGPLPPGAPPDFRKRLAAALKITPPADLAAAEEDFRGVYGSTDEYIRDSIACHLAPHLQWLLSCADPERLREGYENKTIAVWEIRFDESRVMVFESLRGGRK